MAIAVAMGFFGWHFRDSSLHWAHWALAVFALTAAAVVWVATRRS
jgi:hypothetical protein